MRHILVFDADGVLIQKSENFSDYYAREFKVNPEVMKPFFKGAFQECLVGEADLKKELKKVLPSWNWKGTVDEFLALWLSQTHTNPVLLETIKELRKKGIRCYLATNQEKYRLNFLREKVFKGKLDGIVCSAELHVKKSDPDFFRKATVLLNAQPNDINYWDDEQQNVDAARMAGWHAYLYQDFAEFRRQITKLLGH